MLTYISSVTLSLVILWWVSRIFIQRLHGNDTVHDLAMLSNLIFIFLNVVLCGNIKEKTWMMHLVDPFSFVLVPSCLLTSTWLYIYKVTIHSLATGECSWVGSRPTFSQSEFHLWILGERRQMEMTEGRRKASGGGQMRRGGEGREGQEKGEGGRRGR